MATLTLRTETGPLRPQFDSAVDSGKRALKSEEGALSPRSREVNARALRRFPLRWTNAGRGQRVLLLNALKDSRGGVLPMNYTPIGKTDVDAIEVQIASDSLRIKRVGLNEYDMELELVEVR